MTFRVAVLGTGKMGSTLATRLAEAGHDLTLWNRTRARAERLAVGRVVASPADAVADADFVISSLTDAAAVRWTYTGSKGALTAAHGQLYIEMSTTGPDLVAELQPQVAETGSALIDAPISGAPPAVRSGSALIMAGGADGDVERARPLLELFGEVRHVGPLGSGATLKLIANSMLGAVCTAAAELQVNGAAAGLDPEVVFALLVRFVPSLDVRRGGYLHDQHEPALFALRDLDKDLDLARTLFHRIHAPAPLTALVGALVEETTVEGPDLDISALMRRYERSVRARATAERVRRRPSRTAVPRQSRQRPRPGR